MRSIIILAILLIAAANTAHAQSTQALRFFANGLAHSKSGDHVRALAEFESTLDVIERDGASDRFFAKTHYNLGVSLYQLKRLAAAIGQFHKAQRYDHNQYEKAHYALGLAQFEKGDILAARKALSNAVSLNNRNGEAWFDLAFAYLAANELSDARHAFERALKNGAAERSAILNNLGVLLVIEGKYSEALRRFEAANQNDDRSGVARDNLVKCRKLLNETSAELLAANFKYANRGRTERL